MVQSAMLEIKVIDQRHNLPAQTLRHLCQPRMPIIAAFPFNTAVRWAQKSCCQDYW